MCKIPKQCKFCKNTSNREKCPKCRFNPNFSDFFEADPKVLATIELFEPTPKSTETKK